MFCGETSYNTFFMLSNLYGGTLSTPLAKKVFELFGKPELMVETDRGQRQRHASAFISVRSNVVPEEARGDGPYVTAQGELIISLDCHPRYRYWAGGQSIAATLRELSAPQSVWVRYTDVPYGPVQ